MADIDLKADTEAPPHGRLRMPALLRELLHAPAPALAAGVLILLALLALAASWIAASDPIDPDNPSLNDSMTPHARLYQCSIT
ncbi:MAG: hypothetical protein JWO28_1965, partial [Hyphomicrobiales bacterium]|nr:hypothetical protein [Hyphomicrobiales bacterium]